MFASTSSPPRAEPYIEEVDIVERRPLPPGTPIIGNNAAARVATYRQVAPSPFTLTENRSPNHGSQAPFHQRYAHYQHYGFAGKGATSSWARNPKEAILYDS